MKWISYRKQDLLSLLIIVASIAVLLTSVYYFIHFYSLLKTESASKLGSIGDIITGTIGVGATIGSGLLIYLAFYKQSKSNVLLEYAMHQETLDRSMEKLYEILEDMNSLIKDKIIKFSADVETLYRGIETIIENKSFEVPSLGRPSFDKYYINAVKFAEREGFHTQLNHIYNLYNKCYSFNLSFFCNDEFVKNLNVNELNGIVRSHKIYYAIQAFFYSNNVILDDSLKTHKKIVPEYYPPLILIVKNENGDASINIVSKRIFCLTSILLDDKKMMDSFMNIKVGINKLEQIALEDEIKKLQNEYYGNGSFGHILKLEILYWNINWNLYYKIDFNPDGRIDIQEAHYV